MENWHDTVRVIKLRVYLNKGCGHPTLHLFEQISEIFDFTNKAQSFSVNLRQFNLSYC